MNHYSGSDASPKPHTIIHNMGPRIIPDSRKPWNTCLIGILPWKAEKNSLSYQILLWTWLNLLLRSLFSDASTLRLPSRTLTHTGCPPLVMQWMLGAYNRSQMAGWRVLGALQDERERNQETCYITEWSYKEYSAVSTDKNNSLKKISMESKEWKSYQETSSLLFVLVVSYEGMMKNANNGRYNTVILSCHSNLSRFYNQLQCCYGSTSITTYIIAHLQDIINYWQ